jgi:effector-binding domain-containing protein
MNDDSFDVSNIRDPSDITKEVIEKLSAKDAIYLREKFGDRLDSSQMLKEIAEKFTLKDKEQLERKARDTH